MWLQSHVTKVFSWCHSCFRLTSLVIVVTRCLYYFCNFFFFLLASSFFFGHISHSDGIMYQRNHITHTLLMLHGGGMIFSWKILGKLFDGRIIKLQAETCCSLGLLSSISKNTQYWIILAIIFQTLHFMNLYLYWDLQAVYQTHSLQRKFRHSSNLLKQSQNCYEVSLVEMFVEYQNLKFKLQLCASQKFSFWF